MYIDFHTHKDASEPGVLAVRVVRLHPDTPFGIPSCGEDILSVGVHPWDAAGWTAKELERLEVLLRNSGAGFIGETGLDKLCLVPLNEQVKLFDRQLVLAGELQKPVVIHNVRSTELILQKTKEFKEVPAWIYHGFRGKPVQITQWIERGFYLSFGRNFNPESLQACPKERMLLETDEEPVSIQSVYTAAAEVLGCTVDDLLRQMNENLSKLYKK